MAAKDIPNYKDFLYWLGRTEDFFDSLAVAYKSVGTAAEKAIIKAAIGRLKLVTTEPAKWWAEYKDGGMKGLVASMGDDLITGFIVGQVALSASLWAGGGLGLMLGIGAGIFAGVALEFGKDYFGASKLMNAVLNGSESFYKKVEKADPKHDFTGEPGTTLLDPIIVPSVRYPDIDIDIGFAALDKLLSGYKSKYKINISVSDILNIDTLLEGKGFANEYVGTLPSPTVLRIMGEIQLAIDAIIDGYEKNKKAIDKQDPKVKAMIDKLEIAISGINIGMSIISPIVIDLDGTGIESISIEASEASFDFGDDDTIVAHGWLGKGDGFLALDRNGNGIIDDISELFGGRSLDGFTALSKLDENADGLIDERDSSFGKLLVWRDENSDGISQHSELLGLAEVGIASINLSVSYEHAYDNGNWLPLASYATLVDGSRIKIADIYFQTVEQLVDGNGATPDPESLVLLGTRRDDMINGSEKDQIYFGGAGSDVFVFAVASGRDYIADFESNRDRIDISAWGVTEIDQLDIEQHGSDTIVTFLKNKITLRDVPDIGAGDFLFAA